MTALYDNLRKYSKIRGYSLQETAKRAGLSANALYKWKNPKFHAATPTVKAVAEALGITYEQLSGETEKKQPIQVDLKASIDDDDVIMTYDGRPIPKQDLELIKRLMRGE